VQQSEIRQSLTAAGLGSLLAISDLIHIKGLGERRKDSKLPPALRVVDEEKEKGRKRATSIDPTIYNRAIDDGNRWFDQHFKVKVDNWNFYYYYAYERYRSFRELAESNFSEEPEWFTKIFEHLQSTQQPDGHWEPSGVGPQVDTAFAVLFLSRSTRKSIEERGRDLGEGILKGGMGLPPKTADLREKNGRLIDSTLFGSVDELLSLADEKDNPELAALLQTSADLKFDKDVTKRSGQIEQLRSLVRAESFEARLLAVKTLGKDRDLDNAPVLIFALTDPDIRVVLEADRALRALSRKVGGVGLEPGATREQIAEAKKAWTAWLVSIRPDAQLLD
jgi:hypothetical protein